MRTPFHIGGFWFHVDWSADGKTGTDQHGRKWLDKNNPHTESKITEILCEHFHDAIILLGSLKANSNDKSGNIQ